MNFIAKRLNLIGVVLLLVFTAAAAGLYFDVPARLKNQKLKPAAPTEAADKYICPMHPDVKSAKPGNCPKCSMALVPIAQAKATGHEGCSHEINANTDGCCGKKEAAMEFVLPPGHPPIDGMQIHSGCPAGGTATAEKPAK